MNSDVLLATRLAGHRLSRSTRGTAAGVVEWLGAVQAQDFPGARWALGLRAAGLCDVDVLRAYDEGAILRTHVLRPTWHFVTAGDIRWQLALTGKRLIASLAPRHRYLELDARTVSRSRAAIVRALEGGRALTRAELAAVLRRARIMTTPERVGHLLVIAEFEAVICSGPLQSGQLTYALLDERVPPAPALGRDEAIARLAERYFRSHAPATAADFGWWSGLRMRDARMGVEHAARATRPRRQLRSAPSQAWLLPAYDEYLVAYKDRAAVLEPHAVDSRDALAPTVIVNGRAVANWRRTLVADTVRVEIVPRRPLAADEVTAVHRAARRYGAFLARDVSVVVPFTARPRPAS